MTIFAPDLLDCVRLAVGLYWSAADLWKALGVFAAIGPEDVVRAAWIVFTAYWLIAALGRGPAQKRQPRGERLVHILAMICAAYLLFKSEPWPGPLNRRFVPDREWIADAGAALTAAGVALAVWARRHLGKNWNAEVVVQRGHELVHTGPYARLRHPIYTGMLVAVAGTAVAIGEYRGLVALGIFLVGWMLKAKQEEAFLAHEFGVAFEEHKRRTGFFLPKMR